MLISLSCRTRLRQIKLPNLHFSERNDFTGYLAMSHASHVMCCPRKLPTVSFASFSSTRNFSVATTTVGKSDVVQADTKVYGPSVTITFVEGDLEDGNRIIVQALCGKKLVDVALDADVDIEAACGGELACSTCHCIFVDESLYDSLPAKQEEEEDMLDLAAGLTSTSRLSCQLEVTEKYDGAVIVVPGDGF